MSKPHPPSLVRMPVAGFLTWLVPGLGHIYLGDRARGIVCLVTVTVTFWTGVAIGGVRSTVDPQGRTLWFVAQLCTAGNTLAGVAFHRAVTTDEPRGAAAPTTVHWGSADVGVHYTGVAGLLNLLVIFDVLGRAESTLVTGRGKRVRPESVP